MSKKPSKHGPNKAKSIVAQPLFRSRQERAGKGKGSYRREAFQSNRLGGFLLSGCLTASAPLA
jgi:alternative ribosome-rescue factor